MNLKINCINNLVFQYITEAQIKEEKSVREASQNCLDETGSLITSLERAQRERLSRTPPPHLSNIMPPSDLELQLGKKIYLRIEYILKTRHS